MTPIQNIKIKKEETLTPERTLVYRNRPEICKEELKQDPTHWRTDQEGQGQESRIQTGIQGIKGFQKVG